MRTGDIGKEEARSEKREARDLVVVEESLICMFRDWLKVDQPDLLSWSRLYFASREERGDVG